MTNKEIISKIMAKIKNAKSLIIKGNNSYNYYDFSFSKNIYENLLKEYSSYLNLYGNFDLLS